MAEIYKGIAEDGQEKELLRFLDKVFTRLRVRAVPYFLPLLPKLYKHDYRPCQNNIVIRDEKGLRAAVGLYMLTYVCGGETLLAGGIGNVAVGKKFRGMGYMKELMGEALSICSERGADFMVLGGKRQRYNYFGYERVGALYEYRVTATNIRHVLGGGDAQGFSVHRLRKDDTEYLAKIYALRQNAPVHVDCKEDALYDTLRSWFAKPYVLLDDGSFAGYFIVNRSGSVIEELRLLDSAKFPQTVSVIFQELWRSKLKFDFSPAETEANAFFRSLCEDANIRTPESYLILNYRRVLEVLMQEQNNRAPLVDGAFTLHINGFAGEENLRIAADDGQISVTQTDAPPDAALEHLAATRVLFDPLSPERDALPPIARAWFPVPLFFPNADMV
ncbi:MAG: GNAT family N-acetyltransferase [Oscillospiraceae bacterium]|nr:GNAT family N-acetyltransferase [Oscillospiraceae bacterium]